MVWRRRRGSQRRLPLCSHIPYRDCDPRRLDRHRADSWPATVCFFILAPGDPAQRALHGVQPRLAPTWRNEWCANRQAASLAWGVWQCPVESPSRQSRRTIGCLQSRLRDGHGFGTDCRPGAIHAHRACHHGRWHRPRAGPGYEYRRTHRHHDADLARYHPGPAAFCKPGTHQAIGGFRAPAGSLDGYSGRGFQSTAYLYGRQSSGGS